MGSICTVDTHGVAPGVRLDYWNNIVADIFSGMVIDSEAERFDGRLLYVKLGRIGFLRAHSTAATVNRWQGSGRAVPKEQSLVLHLQNAGSCVNRQGGREACLGAGDFTLCDGTRPYSIDLSFENDMLVVDLPLDIVAEHLPAAFDRVLDPVSGTCPSVRMLTAFLLTLWRECSAQEQGDNWVDGLEDVLLNLLGLALNSCSRDSPALDPGGGLRQRLLACIQEKLTDPDLNTAILAAETGVSVRTVQTLFARMGTTPSAFVLERRLALAAEWLQTRPQVRITDIAFDAGFNDPAYFTRRFRQRFGRSPREYRVK